MKPRNFFARGLTGAAVALTALMAGSCDFGNQIVAKSPTEVEGLTGILVVEAGSPAAGAWVRVFPASPTVLAKGGMDAMGAGDAKILALDSMRVGSSGSFRFNDLENGTYNIAATLQQGDTSFSVFLRGVVVAGYTNLGVDTLRVTGSLVVQTLSGSTAISNALCEIEGSPWQAASDDSGICVLTGLPPGVFQITVTHPSYSMTISSDITVLSNILSTAGLLELIANSSPLPAAPLLVSPASLGTVASLQPVLVWSPVTNATSYHVQLSTDTLFTTLLVNDSGRVDTNRTTGTLTADTRYYWRVRAKNTAGVSPWSARWSFQTLPPASGESSLVARWSFDEASGPLALDVSGNSRHGVISGTANRVAGVMGTALEFNGGTHVEIADSLINVSGDFTLTAWVWQSSQATDQPVIDFCCTNSYVGLHLWVNTQGSGIVSPGRVYSNLRPTNPQVNALMYAAPGTLPAGAWNHIAVSYESQTRKGRIYANGAPRDSVTLAAGQVPTLTGALYLGYRTPNTTDARSGTRFVGRMDDVRLYGKRLTTAEIAALHGVPNSAPALVAHWDFNEGAGTTLTDRTGRGHTGTIQGGTWADGVQGKALSFNGTSTRVVVPFAQDLNLRQFTLSAWIKTSLVDGQTILSRQTPSGLGAPWNYRFSLTEAAEISIGTILPGRALADFWPSNDAGVIGDTLIADNTWRHLTAVMEGTTLKMYLNGSLHATKQMGLYPDTTSTQALWIGASAHASGEYFQGLIDEVRIYKGSLNAAQVDSLYSLHEAGSGSPVTQPTSTTTITASQDAGIIASAPSQSGSGPHAALNFGQLYHFGVGTYDMNTVGRGLVRFNLPAGISGSDINRAVIRLHSYDWVQKLVESDSVRINLHRVLRDWTEGSGASQDGTPISATNDGVTGLERMWGAQNGSEDWSEKLVGLNDIDASSTLVAHATRPRSYIGMWEFDVTALVKAWADQPTTNFGVLLAGIIPPENAQTEDYPAFYTREAAVADSLKPQLILSITE